MTYQVLARKWRPRTFTQLVGQSHVALALSHALKTQRLHHAYLFSGTRGVGKTTIARILAKCLNCEQGISSDPCESCAACRAIDEGRYPDLIEVDAASRTRVEDTRELLDNVIYSPTSGRYKIYLIDEVHMLSGHSFNALLKTLEEPPSHVIFLLATTDPEKLPVTVLSRCLQFQLRPIPQAMLENQLSQILNDEKIPFELPALKLLAQAAKGSSRDALSLAEQAIGIGQGHVSLAATELMLGHTFASLLPELLKCLVAQETQQAFELMARLDQSGTDFTLLSDNLLAVFHAWAVCKAVANQEAVMASFSGLPQVVIELHKEVSVEQVQLFYQLTLKGKQDLPLAPYPRVGFEMLALRLMHFRPFESSDAVLPAAAPKLAQSSNLKPTKPIDSITSVTPTEAPVSNQKPLTVAPSKIQVPEKIRQAVVAQAPQSEVWADIAPKLQLSGLAKILVQNCMVGSWQLPKVHLILDAHQAICLSEERRQKIEVGLSTYLGQSISLSIQPGSVGESSPKIIEEHKQTANELKARELLKEDPVAQKMIQTFDATVQKVTLTDEKS